MHSRLRKRVLRKVTLLVHSSSPLPDEESRVRDYERCVIDLRRTSKAPSAMAKRPRELGSGTCVRVSCNPPKAKSEFEGASNKPESVVKKSNMVMLASTLA